MSEFPLWSDLIVQESPVTLREMYPSPIDKGNPAPWMVSEDELTDAQKKRREETFTVEAITDRPIRVGDYVHAGFAVKVGKDKSVRFSNDPTPNGIERIIKAPRKNVFIESKEQEKEATTTMARCLNCDTTFSLKDDLLSEECPNCHSLGEVIREANGDTDYETYFRDMLKKHGYDSPADIPDDKKDDFFNAVDKGYSATNESRRKVASLVEENDDLGMMKGQLMSIVDRANALLDRVSSNPPSNVEAWVQAKVTDADTAITALHDYFKYSDDQNPEFAVEPLAEADEKKDAMVPLRMQAALVIAKSLGTVKGSGQTVDFRVSGGSPEAIVNQAIRVWLSGSHTNEGWALGAKMLKLAKSMGIKWDEKLVRQRLTPLTLKKLGLSEAESNTGPSAKDALRQRHAQEKTQMDTRHEREKNVLQQRAFNDKIQKQQQKQADIQRKKQPV